MDRLLTRLQNGGHKTLIFSQVIHFIQNAYILFSMINLSIITSLYNFDILKIQMTRLLDILEDYLTLRGYKFCRIDGSVK